MSVTIKLRRANASEWAISNIVLDLAEPGYEIDTGKLKIGDGITPWNNLQYIAGPTNTSTPTPTPEINSIISVSNENLISISDETLTYI